MEHSGEVAKAMLAENEPMLPNPYAIRNVRRETDDTFTLDLESTNGAPEFSFGAGQFNMLYVYGVGEIPISISGDPTTKPNRLSHTTRAVGTVTKAMSAMKRGDTLGIRGPFGNCWPIEELAGSDVVIVAGGIGLAPLRPALYTLLSKRQQYGQVVLLYGTRTPADILYRKELEKWRARFDLEVYVTVDRAMGGWRGHVGVVTRLIPRAPFDPLNAVALVCGPEIMMRYAAPELERRGISDTKIYLSLERNMKCAIGFCGHCQFGGVFVCKDGPVFPYRRLKKLLSLWEV